MTVATLPPASYPPAGQAFFKDYQAKYGTPQAYAVYGYEAMSLLLDAVKRATNNGTSAVSRAKVVTALFATKDRPSVLGTYSIDPNGDTTLTSYGAYKIVGGKDAFLKTITPTVA
jgi:branched-chain amino acid transport system substrate-binding protein